MKDPNQVLWLAIASRNSGCRPSEMAGIDDDIAALDFDLAHAVRLEVYDARCREIQAKLIAREVGRLFAGDEGSSEGPRRRYNEADVL